MGTKKCEECPLHGKKGGKVTAYRASVREGSGIYAEVPYRGPTSGVDIVVVGESPGNYEVLKKLPFVGDSGELVEKEFRANGLDPKQVFFANSCRCMLNADSKKDAKLLKKTLACCRPALETALRHLKPKLILCFGDVALQQILKQKGITRHRGKPQRSEEFNCLVFPTFHPAACFRDQGKFAFWKPDMAAVARLARNGFILENSGRNAYKDVDSIRFLLEQTNLTVAFDTETQGKDWTDPNSVVISYSVSVESGTGYNIWLLHECEKEESDFCIKWPRKDGKKVKEAEVFVKKAVAYDEKIRELEELCSREDIKLFMHNGNYDLHRLRQLGIPREKVKKYTFDTQMGAHALDPDNFIKASLLDVQDAFCNDRTDHKTSFKQSADISDMLLSARQNPEQYSNYACGDTDATFTCANVLRNRISQDKKLANYYAHLALPVQSEILYDIEKNGIQFDMAKLPETKDRVAFILREKEREFLALVPRKARETHKETGLKLTRTNFIRDVFFSKKGFDLPVLKKTPTGDPTTDRKILVRLRDDLQDGEAKEALSLLIEWGPYQKLYSTYLKGFEAAVKADGRLHTQITKTGTATGRTSSSNPNLQNIPKRNKTIMTAIRSMLCAPPGKVLVAADYSQSELRWIAHESEDGNMMHIFRNGQDMHLITAQGMAKKRNLVWERMEQADRDKYRQDAKPVNFGFPYGQSAGGFQAYARDNYGAVFSLEEAELYRRVFLYESYPGLIPWHERRIAEAKRYGFVRSAYGFIRQTPNIRHKEDFIRGEDERIAVNTGIQSASNDSTLLGALEAKRSGIADDIRAQLSLFIHDELIYAVDEDYVDKFVPKLLDHMENLPTERFGFMMKIPLVAEASVGMNLAEMKKLPR